MQQTPLNPPLIQTDILLLDIVGFSKMRDTVQYHSVQIVQAITKQLIDRVNEVEKLRGRFPKTFGLVIGTIPTGDGFYLVLHPAVAGYGPLFGLSQKNQFDQSAETIQGFYEGVRVAAHSGIAIPLRDINHQINFIGSGLNDAARLLSPPDKVVESIRDFAVNKSYVEASCIARNKFMEVVGNEWLNSIEFKEKL